MKNEIGAATGVDLAASIMNALAAGPLTAGYFVETSTVTPNTGTVWAIRVRDVSVDAALANPVGTSAGQAFGHIDVDITFDADACDVTNGLPNLRPVSLNQRLSYHFPLVWAGRKFDFNVPPTNGVPFDNARDRADHKVVWASLPFADRLAPTGDLPAQAEALLPNWRMPNVVAAAVWPDECAIDHYVPPVSNALPAALLTALSNALVEVITGLLGGANALATGVGPGGARAVTIDLQGRHVFFTAVPWSADDDGRDPTERGRRFRENLSLDWSPGGPWAMPMRVMVSPELMERTVRLNVGNDAVRNEATESVTSLDLIVPDGATFAAPWLGWFVGEALAGIVRPQAFQTDAEWGLASIRLLEFREQVAWADRYLATVRSDFWALLGYPWVNVA